MPILVSMFGVRDAIPILTVAQLIGNASRVWFNRHELELPVVGWFAVGGVPAALVGGFFFASAPVSFLMRLLGLFLIMTVVYRHIGKASVLRIPLGGFAILGAVFSFLSALLGSIGPIMIPFFLAYGLVKGSLIGTEALATVVMHVTKLVVYRRVSLGLHGAAREETASRRGLAGLRFPRHTGMRRRSYKNATGSRGSKAVWTNPTWGYSTVPSVWIQTTLDPHPHPSTPAAVHRYLT